MKSEELIKEFLVRDQLRSVQTPQAFKLKIIQQAHNLAVKKGISGFTDDCSLVKKLKLTSIKVIEGDPLNIKITYPIDFQMAEKIYEIINSM